MLALRNTVVRSKISPCIDFSYDQCVLALVRHNRHAIILRENHSASYEYELKKIDFVPADKTYCFLYGADIGQLFFSATCNGIVQIQDFQHKTKSLLECTREDIFNQLHLVDEAVVWLYSINDVSPMMGRIQREHSDKNQAPAFNIKGKRGDSGSGHNCCTWAVERLEMIVGNNAHNYISSGSIAYTLNLPKIYRNDQPVHLGLVSPSV